MTDSSDYVGSAGTYIDEIEIFDYDEYVELYGELPLDGIADDDDEGRPRLTRGRS